MGGLRRGGMKTVKLDCDRRMKGFKIRGGGEGEEEIIKERVGKGSADGNGEKSDEDSGQG